MIPLTVYIEMLLVWFLLADAVLATIAAYLTHMKSGFRQSFTTLPVGSAPRNVEGVTGRLKNQID